MLKTVLTFSILRVPLSPVLILWSVFFVFTGLLHTYIVSPKIYVWELLIDVLDGRFHGFVCEEGRAQLGV